MSLKLFVLKLRDDVFKKNLPNLGIWKRASSDTCNMLNMLHVTYATNICKFIEDADTKCNCKFQ